MGATVQPSASGGVQVPTVRPSEQAVHVNFHVVVMDDPDTGQPTLCTANDPHESIREATLASVLEQAAAAHKKTDDGVQLAVRHATAEQRKHLIHNPDGTLSEAGQKVLDETTELLTELAMKAPDPRAAADAFIAEFVRATSGPRGHYPWCETDACRTVDGDDYQHTEHQGPIAALPATEDIRAHHGNYLDARLFTSDEPGKPLTVVSILSANGNGELLTGPGLDKLIDDTANFLNQLRLMRPHVGEVQA
ncbi:DUF6907 domain-containing protein [Streptomyces sp. NPDC101249]|uniref:DUF6907 domain-containing protein n=1 Tax=Streptomyces sp. NPDC101249 TaxID=3366140 RepID=UPI0037FB6014